MQSYKLNIVSEHLKDRHPYLELAFNDRYDPSEVHKYKKIQKAKFIICKLLKILQVYLAVFDRSIPKLIEILEMPGLNPETYKNALITLNEMVSH